MRPLRYLGLIGVIGALAASGVGVLPAASYQHIDNGGFEDGPAGWSTDSATTLAVTADSAFSGGAGGRLSGSGRLRLTTSLDRALGAGPYQLTLQLRAAADATATLRIAAGEWGQVEASQAVPAGSWTAVEADFNLPTSEQASITILIDGASQADIDDVTLDGAPPVVLTPTPQAALTLTATPVSGTASPVPSQTTIATPTIVTDAIAAHVRNAGFEELDGEGLPFAWQKYGGTLASTGHAHAGGRAAHLTSATDSTKWAYQDVTVEPGRWYALSAWLASDGAARAAYLRVSWYPSGDASGSALTTDDSPEGIAGAAPYRLLTTGPVQAPADAHSARLRMMLAPSSAAAASITVDDVGWAQVPPPVATPTPEVAVAAGQEQAASDPDPAAAVRARRGSRSSHSDLPSLIAGVPSNATIVINEVLYDADGAAADSDLEWVELYNASDAPVDIGGWAFVDARSGDVLPPLVVPAHGLAIVAATAAFRQAWPEYRGALAVIGGRIGNGLGNEGDALYLLDPAGRAIDAVSWGDNAFALNPAMDDVPEGHSIERNPAGRDTGAASDWIDNERPSPGRGYTAVSDGGGAPRAARPVQVIEATDRGSWRLAAAWALAGASGAALAAAVGWRTLEAVRGRLRQQP